MSCSNSVREPLVSVVIPCYNCAGKIWRALNSILIQNYPQLEIIIVDDGSDENIADTIDSFNTSFSIIYLKQENKGAAAARNLALRNSSGKYICFLDSDDYLLPNSIDSRVNVLNNHPEIGLVFTDFSKIIQYKGRNVTFRHNDLAETKFLEHLSTHLYAPAENNVYLFEKDIFFELIIRSFIWTGTVMIRREVLSCVGYFSEKLKISEDHDFWLRICAIYPIAFYSICTAVYTMHDKGITKNIPLYYESAISVRSKFLHKCHHLPPEYISRLKIKLAAYLYSEAYYFYKNANFRKSNNCFLRSAAYNHLNLSTYLYIFLTWFPPKLIFQLRKLKQKAFNPVLFSKRHQ